MKYAKTLKIRIAHPRNWIMPKKKKAEKRGKLEKNTVGSGVW